MVEAPQSGVVIVHVLPQNRLALDPLVVDGDLVFGVVVVDDHLVRSHNGHLAEPSRVEPADMDVRHDLVRVDRCS